MDNISVKIEHILYRIHNDQQFRKNHQIQPHSTCVHKTSSLYIILHNLKISLYYLSRYLANCHPSYSYTMSGLHRASKIIAVVWFLALITAIPYAVCTEVLLQPHPITNEVNFIYMLYIYITLYINNNINSKINIGLCINLIYAIENT